MPGRGVPRVEVSRKFLGVSSRAFPKTRVLEGVSHAVSRGPSGPELWSLQKCFSECPDTLFL